MLRGASRADTRFVQHLGAAVRAGADRLTRCRDAPVSNWQYTVHVRRTRACHLADDDAGHA